MSIATLRKTFLKALKDENEDLILAALETLEREHPEVAQDWWKEASLILHKLNQENNDRWPSPPRGTYRTEEKSDDLITYIPR